MPRERSVKPHCSVCRVPKSTAREKQLSAGIVAAASEGTLQAALNHFLQDPLLWEASEEYNPAYFTGAPRRSVNLGAWSGVLNIFDDVYTSYLQDQRFTDTVVQACLAPEDKNKNSNSDTKQEGRTKETGAEAPETVALNATTPIDTALVLSCLQFSSVLLSLCCSDRRMQFSSEVAVTSLLSSTEQQLADAALHLLFCLVWPYPYWRSEHNSSPSMITVDTRAHGNREVIKVLKTIISDIGCDAFGAVFDNVLVPDQSQTGGALAQNMEIPLPPNVPADIIKEVLAAAVGASPFPLTFTRATSASADNSSTGNAPRKGADTDSWVLNVFTKLVSAVEATNLSSAGSPSITKKLPAGDKFRLLEFCRLYQAVQCPARRVGVVARRIKALLVLITIQGTASFFERHLFFPAASIGPRILKCSQQLSSAGRAPHELVLLCLNTLVVWVFRCANGDDDFEAYSRHTGLHALTDGFSEIMHGALDSTSELLATEVWLESSHIDSLKAHKSSPSKTRLLMARVHAAFALLDVCHLTRYGAIISSTCRVADNIVMFMGMKEPATRALSLLTQFQADFLFVAPLRDEAGSPAFLHHGAITGLIDFLEHQAQSICEEEAVLSQLAVQTETKSNSTTAVWLNHLPPPITPTFLRLQLQHHDRLMVVANTLDMLSQVLDQFNFPNLAALLVSPTQLNEAQSASTSESLAQGGPDSGVTTELGESQASPVQPASSPKGKVGSSSSTETLKTIQHTPFARLFIQIFSRSQIFGTTLFSRAIHLLSDILKRDSMHILFVVDHIVGPTLFDDIVHHRVRVTHTGLNLVPLPTLIRRFTSHPRTQSRVLPVVRGFVQLYFYHCLRNGGQVNSRVPSGYDESPLIDAFYEMAETDEAKQAVADAAVEVVEQVADYFCAQNSPVRPSTKVIFDYFCTRQLPCTNPVNSSNASKVGLPFRTTDFTTRQASVDGSQQSHAVRTQQAQSSCSVNADDTPPPVKRARLKSMATLVQDESSSPSCQETGKTQSNASTVNGNDTKNGEAPKLDRDELFAYGLEVSTQAAAGLLHIVVDKHNFAKMLKRGFVSTLMRLSVLCARHSCIQNGFSSPRKQSYSVESAYDDSEKTTLLLLTRCSRICSRDMEDPGDEDVDKVLAKTDVKLSLTGQVVQALEALAAELFDRLTGINTSDGVSEKNFVEAKFPEWMAVVLRSAFSGSSVPGGHEVDTTYARRRIFDLVCQTSSLLGLVVGSLMGHSASKPIATMQGLKAVVQNEATFIHIADIFNILRAVSAMDQLEETMSEQGEESPDANAGLKTSSSAHGKDSWRDVRGRSVSVDDETPDQKSPARSLLEDSANSSLTSNLRTWRQQCKWRMAMRRFMDNIASLLRVVGSATTSISPKFCVNVKSFVSRVFSRLRCFQLFPNLAAQPLQEFPSWVPGEGETLPKELLSVYRASVSLIVQPIMLRLLERNLSRRHQSLGVKRKSSAAGYSRGAGDHRNGSSGNFRRESHQAQAKLLCTQCLNSMFAAIFGDLVSLLYLDNSEPVLFNLVVLSSCGMFKKIYDIVRLHTDSTFAGEQTPRLEPFLDSLNVLRMATRRRQASFGPLATLICPKPVLLRTFIVKNCVSCIVETMGICCNQTETTLRGLEPLMLSLYPPNASASTDPPATPALSAGVVLQEALLQSWMTIHHLYKLDTAVTVSRHVVETFWYMPALISRIFLPVFPFTSDVSKLDKQADRSESGHCEAQEFLRDFSALKKQLAGSWKAQSSIFFGTILALVEKGVEDDAQDTLAGINVREEAEGGDGKRIRLERLRTAGHTSPSMSVAGNLTVSGLEAAPSSKSNTSARPPFMDVKDPKDIFCFDTKFTADRRRLGAILRFGSISAAAAIMYEPDLRSRHLEELCERCIFEKVSTLPARLPSNHEPVSKLQSSSQCRRVLYFLRAILEHSPFRVRLHFCSFASSIVNLMSVHLAGGSANSNHCRNHAVNEISPHSDIIGNCLRIVRLAVMQQMQFNRLDKQKVTNNSSTGQPVQLDEKRGQAAGTSQEHALRGLDLRFTLDIQKLLVVVIELLQQYNFDSQVADTSDGQGSKDRLGNKLPMASDWSITPPLLQLVIVLCSDAGLARRLESMGLRRHLLRLLATGPAHMEQLMTRTALHLIFKDEYSIFHEAWGCLADRKAIGLTTALARTRHIFFRAPQLLAFVATSMLVPALPERLTQYQRQIVVPAFVPFVLALSHIDDTSGSSWWNEDTARGRCGWTCLDTEAATKVVEQMLCDSPVSAVLRWLSGESRRSLVEAAVIAADDVRLLLSSHGKTRPRCNRGHPLFMDQREFNECDLCSCTGTSFRCAFEMCDYDVCRECWGPGCEDTEVAAPASPRRDEPTASSSVGAAGVSQTNNQIGATSVNSTRQVSQVERFASNNGENNASTQVVSPTSCNKEVMVEMKASETMAPNWELFEEYKKVMHAPELVQCELISSPRVGVTPRTAAQSDRMPPHSTRFLRLVEDSGAAMMALFRQVHTPSDFKNFSISFGAAVDTIDINRVRSEHTEFAKRQGESLPKGWSELIKFLVKELPTKGEFPGLETYRTAIEENAADLLIALCATGPVVTAAVLGEALNTVSHQGPPRETSSPSDFCAVPSPSQGTTATGCGKSTWKENRWSGAGVPALSSGIPRLLLRRLLDAASSFGVQHVIHSHRWAILRTLRICVEQLESMVDATQALVTDHAASTLDIYNILSSSVLTKTLTSSAASTKREDLDALFGDLSGSSSSDDPGSDVDDVVSVSSHSSDDEDSSVDSDDDESAAEESSSDDESSMIESSVNENEPASGIVVVRNGTGDSDNAQAAGGGRSASSHTTRRWHDKPPSNESDDFSNAHEIFRHSTFHDHEWTEFPEFEYDFGQSDSEPDDAHEMQIDNFGSAQRDFFRNNHDVQIRSHHHIIDGHSTSARIPEVPTVILATANGSFELPSLLGHFFQFAPQYSEPRGARAGEDEHSWMQLQQDIVYACGIHAQDSYQPNRSIAAEKRMLKEFLPTEFPGIYGFFNPFVPRISETKALVPSYAAPQQMFSVSFDKYRVWLESVIQSSHQGALDDKLTNLTSAFIKNFSEMGSIVSFLDKDPRSNTSTAQGQIHGRSRSRSRSRSGSRGRSRRYRRSGRHRHETNGHSLSRRGASPTRSTSISRSESPGSPRRQRRSRSRSRDGANDRFAPGRRTVDVSGRRADADNDEVHMTSGATGGSQARLASPNSSTLPSGGDVDTSDANDTQVTMVRESSSHDEPATFRRASRNRARTSSFAGSLSSQRRRESTEHSTSSAPNTTRTDSHDSPAPAHQTGPARDRNYSNSAGRTASRNGVPRGQSSVDENGIPVDWVGAPTLVPNLGVSPLPASQPSRFSSALSRTRSSAAIHSDVHSTTGHPSGLGITVGAVTDVRPEGRSALQPNLRRWPQVGNHSNNSAQSSSASRANGSEVSSVSPTTPPRLAAGLMSPFRRNPLPKESATGRPTSIFKPYLGPIFTDPDLFRSKVLPLHKLATILPLLYAPGTSFNFEGLFVRLCKLNRFFAVDSADVLMRLVTRPFRRERRPSITKPNSHSRHRSQHSHRHQQASGGKINRFPPASLFGAQAARLPENQQYLKISSKLLHMLKIVTNPKTRYIPGHPFNFWFGICQYTAAVRPIKSSRLPGSAPAATALSPRSEAVNATLETVSSLESVEMRQSAVAKAVGSNCSGTSTTKSPMEFTRRIDVLLSLLQDSRLLESAPHRKLLLRIVDRLVNVFLLVVKHANESVSTQSAGTDNEASAALSKPTQAVDASIQGVSDAKAAKSQNLQEMRWAAFLADEVNKLRCATGDALYRLSDDDVDRITTLFQEQEQRRLASESSAPAIEETGPFSSVSATDNAGGGGGGAKIASVSETSSSGVSAAQSRALPVALPLRRTISNASTNSVQSTMGKSDVYGLAKLRRCMATIGPELWTGYIDALASTLGTELLWAGGNTTQLQNAGQRLVALLRLVGSESGRDVAAHLRHLLLMKLDSRMTKLQEQFGRVSQSTHSRQTRNIPRENVDGAESGRDVGTESPLRAYSTTSRARTEHVVRHQDSSELGSMRPVTSGDIGTRGLAFVVDLFTCFAASSLGVGDHDSSEGAVKTVPRGKLGTSSTSVLNGGNVVAGPSEQRGHKHGTDKEIRDAGNDPGLPSMGLDLAVAEVMNHPVWEVLDVCLSQLAAERPSNSERTSSDLSDRSLSTNEISLPVDGSSTTAQLRSNIASSADATNGSDGHSSSSSHESAARQHVVTELKWTKRLARFIDYLLPVLEAFTVLHGKLNRSRFLAMCQRHATILNEVVRLRPELLLDALSLGSLVGDPRKEDVLSSTSRAATGPNSLHPYASILDFHNKCNYFRRCLQREQDKETDVVNRRGADNLAIEFRLRRDHIFRDSFVQVSKLTPKQLKMKWVVQFAGEAGIDEGGLTREWYNILSRHMFNEDFALFKLSADGSTHSPNPYSEINPQHLQYFKFIGRVIGKAVRDNHHFGAHFTRSFYKHMLGLAVTFEDLESVDAELYNGLVYFKDNEIDEDDETEIYFSVDHQFAGHQRTVELIPGGASVMLTEQNKHEYIRLMTRYRLFGSIQQQLESFLEGFHELIDQRLVSIFDENELELVISGLPTIDVDDLEAHTVYTGYVASSENIKWFWATVRELPEQDRAKLLQFVTGTSKVPLGGFAQLKFRISWISGGPHRLPSAHTCMNALDLPQYESHEQLRTKLLMVLQEGSEGFAFA